MAWKRRASVDLQTPSLDVLANATDHVDVRIEQRVSGLVLYVDIQGITILRIGLIKNEIEVTRDESKATEEAPSGNQGHGEGHVDPG